MGARLFQRPKGPGRSGGEVIEIKANFLLIGLFTLAGLAAVLATFLWLGAVRIDREVARYGILFPDVSGLAMSGDVVFNGLSVGRVTTLRLHEDNPALIYAGIEIDANTPVRADTVAQLTSQGVTGVAYIALIGGTAEAPPLVSDDDDLPLIPARRAALQTLIADVPGLVEEASILIADLRALAGPETRQPVANILANVEAATGKLDATLDGMAGLTEGLSAAAVQIGGLGDTINGLEGDLRGTLARADTALDAATASFDAATPALTDAREMLSLTRALLDDDAPATLAAWRAAGDRLDSSLAQADAALDAFGTTSEAVGNLATGDGAAILANTRQTVEAASPALRAALSDLRAAAADTRAALADITDGVASATDQLDPMATEARAALRQASDLLTRTRPSLDRLDAALTSADTAFETATGVIETDIGPAMGDLREAATAIARDLPDLTARASTVVGDIGRAVDAVAPGLRAFGTSTLPELDTLAAETRTLIRSLSDLVRRIERDPARLLQGDQVPEYRR